MWTALAFLILIEQGSPGLVPSIKFSYVTLRMTVTQTRAA